jgi:hypothetical protein
MEARGREEALEQVLIAHEVEHESLHSAAFAAIQSYGSPSAAATAVPQAPSAQTYGSPSTALATVPEVPEAASSPLDDSTAESAGGAAIEVRQSECWLPCHGFKLIFTTLSTLVHCATFHHVTWRATPYSLIPKPKP